MTIREETPADFDAIREVNRLAFGGDAEALLVDRLRAEGLAILSLVAEDNGRVVGHILFSRLPVETQTGELAAVSLAPVAVRPEAQRRGIGAELTRAGLKLLSERGETVVVVVGHPAYYPRFGFSAALARRLRSPYEGEFFMALELAPGALEGIAGRVRYPEAFAGLE